MQDDEQDDFGALYGDAGVDASKNAEPAQKPATAGNGTVAEDDDSLFMQLYGDQPPPEEAERPPAGRVKSDVPSGRQIRRSRA